MKEWRKKAKRILVLLLTAALIGNTVDFPVSAVFAAENRETGLCRHHQSHTVECGYSEEDNMPCGYECRICPMEDLIAALPDEVTEDNRAEVEAQLHEILDLYRELTWEEQEQIDMTLCWDLQAALDAANAPAPIDEPTEGAVAQVEIAGNITYHNTIEEAWTAANGNTATITLLADVTASGMLTVDAGSTITFDGGDHTLTSGQQIAIEVDGTFKLVSGTIHSTYSSLNARGINVNGTLEMTGGAVTTSNSRTSASRAVRADSNSNITIFSGKISGVYGIGTAGGTVIIQNGEISGSMAAVDVNNGNVTIEGGTFTSSGSYGMNIESGTVVLRGGTFTGGDNAIQTPNSVASLLDKSKPYVYFDANAQPVALEDGQTTLPGGTYTVGECTHLGALKDLGNGTHGAKTEDGTCPYCGTDIAAATHTLGPDNKCKDCKAELKVQVEIDNATTYYGGIGPAWTAARNAESATVTLLDDAMASYMMVAGGDDITFDGGEFTLTGPSNNNKFIDISGGKLTVTGGTLKTGENTSGHLSADIIISGGELVVTGGSLEAGTDCVGLFVMGNAPVVKLSGGTFHGIGMNTDTVGRLLLNYGSTNATEKHYAYYQGDEPVDLTKLERQYVLTDTVTVQECEHEGVTPTANSDGTHSLKCPYCGYTGPEEDCSYGTEYQHDDTNHWKTCTVCRYENREAHNWEFYSASSGNVIENYWVCFGCGRTKDHLTLTITVPDGLTYGNTEGKQVTCTVSPETTCDKVRWRFTGGSGPEFADGVLPAGLSVGEHWFRVEGLMADETLVFSGSYYLTVSAAPLTGDMVTLSTESVTYNGMEQKPTITVKQGNTTLAEGTDYDVSYSPADFTNAGTVTVTITGKGNYTGTVETAYTIKKAPLTITASSQTITYGGSITQGTDNVSAAGLCSGDSLDGITLTAGIANVPGGNITPSAAGIKNSGGKDVTGNYEITYKDGGLTINKADAEITVGTGTYNKTYGDAAFTLDVTDNNTEADVQYEVTAGADVVSVSNGTVTIKNAGTATITVSLPETANYNAAASKTITVNVTQKGGYTVAEQNRSYLYSRENTGSIDLAALLPKDCGAVTYGTPAASGDVTYSAAPDVNDGKLSYTLNSGDIDDEGTITVTVATRNYTDITITVKVKLTDQIPVGLKDGTEVTLINNTLTYGEPLSELLFNEAEFIDGDGKPVEGTLAWKDAAATPNAGTTSAVWVFTPTDTAYMSVEGTAAMTVNRAAPTVSETLAVADRVYNPSQVLEQGDLSDITVTGVDGKTLEGEWNWQSANIVPTVNNSGYAAVFTPTDTTNYETVTRTVTVNVTKAVPYIAGLPAAAGITYGDTLNVSALSGGTVQHGSGTGQAGSTETVAGAFTWKEPSTKPVAADSNVTEYTIVFTPSDTANYNSVEAKVKLTVNKAQNVPNMPGSAMSVSNSIEKVGSVPLPAGWEWQASDKDTALEAGAAVSAVAVYTGADKGNYENETVTVAITRSSCDHVAGNVLYTGEGEKEPTCTGEGLGHRECTKCGSVVESGIVVPTLGHHYKSEVTTEPTTDREGIRTYTCTRCGEQYSESIPKLTDSTEKAVSLTEVKIKDMASEKKKQLTVSWNPVEGADGYEVIYASDKSFTKNKVTKKTTKTSLTLKKLNEKKTWYVKVRAYAKKGTETYTGKYSAARYIKLSQRPANVKKITVKAGTKKLSVTAGSVKGATGYEIVVSTDKAGKKTVASKKAAKGKASFTKLGKKKTYYVTVRAYKKTKNGGYLYSAKKVTKIKTK